MLGAGAVLVALNAGARAAEMLHVMAHAEVRAVLADAAHPETPGLLTGRPAARLTFDLQREVARRMGYADRPGRSSVERFNVRFLTARPWARTTRRLR